jgi:hypothetical protein
MCNATQLTPINTQPCIFTKNALNRDAAAAQAPDNEDMVKLQERSVMALYVRFVHVCVCVCVCAYVDVLACMHAYLQCGKLKHGFM